MPYCMLSLMANGGPIRSDLTRPSRDRCCYMYVQFALVLNFANENNKTLKNTNICSWLAREIITLYSIRSKSNRGFVFEIAVLYRS